MPLQSERLEARIRELYMDSEATEADFDGQPRDRTRRSGTGDSPYDGGSRTLPSGAYTLGQTRASAAASALLPSTGMLAAASETRRSRGRDDTGSVSRSARSVSRPGGSSSPAATASAAATSGLHFRSPMYRSASPSRRVGKDNVVTSNLSRAPRFREQKADVPGECLLAAAVASAPVPADWSGASCELACHALPRRPDTSSAPSHYAGPGKYRPHDTDFGPVRVSATEDTDGRFGHTWSAWYASKGLKPTAAATHTAAIAAATARIKAPPTVRPGDELALALMSSVDNNGNSNNDAAPTNSVEVAAVALIRAAGGNARLALEASIRRERALRRELEAAERSLTAQRAAVSAAQSTARTEVEAAASESHSSRAALEASIGRARSSAAAATAAEEALSGVQRAVNELGTALATAEAAASGSGGAGLQAGLARALARFPALGRLVDATRSAEAAAAAAANAASAAASSSSSTSANAGGGRGGSRSARGGDRNGGSSSPASAASTAPSFLGYSSMAAALGGGDGAGPAPQSVGGLGASEGLIKAHTAGGAPGASATAAAAIAAVPSNSRPMSPAAAAARFGRPTAFRGVTAAEIAGHAARGARAVAAEAAAVAETQQRQADQLQQQEQEQQQQQQERHQQQQQLQEQQQQQRSSRRASSAVAPTATAAPARELSVADTLQQLATWYAASDGGGAELRPGAFYRLLRDAGALDNRVVQHDISAAFSRATAKSHAAALGPSELIAALNDVANLRFSAVARGAPGGGAEAFRALLRAHLLPLHARLHASVQRAGGGVVPRGGGGEDDPAFAEALQAPAMLAFTSAHRGALTSMFTAYALHERGGPNSGSGAAQWETARDGGAALSRRAAQAWASDFKVVPDLTTRAAFVAIFVEIATAAGARHDGEPEGSSEK